MVIYADEVFAINLIVNYLVLLAASKLCAISGNRVRMALGAVLGGVYAVTAIIIPFMRHPMIKLSVGVLMTMAAFGGHKRLLRIILTVFGVSAAFAGVVYAISLMTGVDITGTGYISVSFKMLILAFGVCYMAVDIVFKRLARTTSEIISLTVEYRGRSTVITALKDTGHSLADPLTGKPVLIADSDTLAPLFGKDSACLDLSPTETVERLVILGHSFRLITYNAVGMDAGLLAAFSPDSVKIKGKPIDCIIAVSPNGISDGGAYSALIGADYD